MEKGYIYTEKFSFDTKDVLTFIKLSGDTNPIHHDEEYVKDTVFKKPILHGFLSVTIFSKIFGTTFPGTGCAYMEQNFKFIKPMYPDTEYVAEVVVTNFDVARKILYVQTNIKEGTEYTIIGTAVLKVN